MIKVFLKEDELISHNQKRPRKEIEGLRIWWLGAKRFFLHSWHWAASLLLTPIYSDSLTKKYAATEKKPHVRMSELCSFAPEIEFSNWSLLPITIRSFGCRDAQADSGSQPGIRFVFPKQPGFL